MTCKTSYSNISYPNISFGKVIKHNDKTLCDLCERETSYIAAKRCSQCWEMEQGLRMLADKNKDKAVKWLEERLKELRD